MTRLLRIAVGGAAVLLVAFVALSIWKPVRVDQAPRGPVVQNDTAVTVYVYMVEPDGSEIFRLRVPTDSEVELVGNCSGELVARTTSGDLIERWEPSVACDTGTWVLEENAAQQD